MNFTPNPILSSDFYKTGHPAQFSKNLRTLYSNFTARSNRLAPTYGDKQIQKIVICGIQGFVKQWLLHNFNEGFFKKSKEQVLKEYLRRTDGSLGPGSVTVEHIAALHDLGYLPVRIKALPEGSVVDMKVPFLTVKNTVDGFGWVVGYLETMLSAEIWKPITTASIAFEYKKLLQSYAEQTGSPLDFVMWQGHDFSMRGMSGVIDAAQSGQGHLLSFFGTDTIPAIEYLEQMYNAQNSFVGGSVPASEHAVASSNIIEIETALRLHGSFEGVTVADLT